MQLSKIQSTRKKQTLKSRLPRNADAAHQARNTFQNYILLFISCAFIGWVWEVTLTFIQHGYFANRGVLHGPWLPIYGFGGLIITLFLQNLKERPALVFIAAALACGLMEYLTAWYLESIKHLKWWDYSGLPFNLHGRVCLLSILAFGCCGLLLTYLVSPNLFHFYNLIPLHSKSILAAVFLTVFISDAIYSSHFPNTGTGVTTNIHQTTNLDP